MASWLYFHRVSPRVAWLDHRLAPEVRACLAAMMSRVPAGGIESRYADLVDAVAGDLAGQGGDPGLLRACAESRLCERPLHPRVQGFFDKYVGQYGHGSIQELTGDPVVFVEGISQALAYLSFDNPLVSGQEMSTRATWREDWPFAQDLPRDPDLLWLHETGLRIAAAEIESWKSELRSPCPDGPGCAAECASCRGTGMKYPWMTDPQPFRPAFDRARWALPGTAATGIVHTASVRVMGRVYHQLRDASVTAEAGVVLDEVRRGYEQAMPGLAPRAFAPRERAELPEHLLSLGRGERAEPRFLEEDPVAIYREVDYGSYQRIRGYLDPQSNHDRVNARIRASFAACRDWHRHRVAYPLSVSPLFGARGFVLHELYRPLSDLGRELQPEYFLRAAAAHRRFSSSGDLLSAAASIPFGATTRTTFQAGTRDATYVFELRADPPGGGANFEYQAHARQALRHLRP